MKKRRAFFKLPYYIHETLNRAPGLFFYSACPSAIINPPIHGQKGRFTHYVQAGLEALRDQHGGHRARYCSSAVPAPPDGIYLQ